MNDIYLGDGVYFLNDGFHAILRTYTDTIYLDDDVITAFLQQIARFKRVDITVENLRGEKYSFKKD